MHGIRFVTLPLLWNLLSCSFTSCQATIVTSFHCHPLHRSWRVTFSLADLFTWFLHLSSVVISRRLRGALILDGLVFVSLDVIIQAKDFHCDNTSITLVPSPPPPLEDRFGQGQLHFRGAVYMRCLLIFAIHFFHAIFSSTAAMYRTTDTWAIAFCTFLF